MRAVKPPTQDTLPLGLRLSREELSHQHAAGNAKCYGSSQETMRIEPKLYAGALGPGIKRSMRTMITGNRLEEIVRTMRIDQLVGLLGCVASKGQVTIEKTGDELFA